MKITFTKPHLNYSIGDSIDVSIEQANYFERMGIAEISSHENDLDIDEPKKRGRKPNAK
jgi:hypothetical protein